LIRSISPLVRRFGLATVDEADIATRGNLVSDGARLAPSGAPGEHPANNRLKNLPLRQRCHMLRDRPHHLAQRWITYRRRSADRDLSLEPYPARSPRYIETDAARVTIIRRCDSGLRPQCANSGRSPTPAPDERDAPPVRRRPAA
jgi:hypothetical protein